MRGAHRSLGLLSFALIAGACGGGDLTLPGPGSPATLTIIAGDGQSGSQGQPLADPLVVEVRDGEGRPLAGTNVAFRFTDSLPDALVDPGSAPTDLEGRATAHAQLGRRTGSQAIEAEVAVPGQDSPCAVPVDRHGGSHSRGWWGRGRRERRRRRLQPTPGPESTALGWGRWWRGGRRRRRARARSWRRPRKRPRGPGRLNPLPSPLSHPQVKCDPDHIR